MSKSDFAKASNDEKVREFANDLPGMKSLILEGPGITDRTLELLAASCLELKELSLSETMASDAGVQYIGKLASLEWLCVDSEKVTDRCLPPIVALPQLKGLQLIGCGITDNGFASLKQLNGLSYLEIVSTNEIGTDGLRSLTEKPNLEYLRLSAVKTDEEKFSKLSLGSSLRSFTFEMPAVSDQAIQLLRRKFPKCQIERYQFQRSEYQPLYEAAMKIAVKKTPSLTQFRPKPSVDWTSEFTQQGVQTSKLTPQEVQMLKERGLLDPDFKC